MNLHIHCAIFVEPHVIHCATTQSLDPVSKCAMLVVISPHHGSVDYEWELEDDCDAYFPSNTGVIYYVRNTGIYQCTVGEDIIKFEVLGNILHSENC